MRDNLTFYIAGPMTIRGQKAHWNFPTFYIAQANLSLLGYPSYNPAEYDLIDRDMEVVGRTVIPTQTFDIARVRRRDVELLSRSNAVLFLDGWEDSPGSRFEARIGLQCRYRFFTMTFDEYEWPILTEIPSEVVENVVYGENGNE